jgi:hypothetical protein
VLVKSGSQESIANWRNDKVTDQGIGVSQCLRDATSISAIGNVKFCGYLLFRQRNQSVPADWLA